MSIHPGSQASACKTSEVKTMMLVRFRWNHDSRWGVIEGKDVWAIRGSVYGDFDIFERIGSMDTLELLPPCEPSKVVALAYNYKDLV